jgi:hypothetical protein
MSLHRRETGVHQHLGLNQVAPELVELVGKVRRTASASTGRLDSASVFVTMRAVNSSSLQYNASFAGFFCYWPDAWDLRLR